MSNEDKKVETLNTQTGRRAVYGTNVTITLLIVFAIVVLLNWIGERHFERFDVTSLGSYSLSQQTRQIVGKLKGDYKIVTLFDLTPETQKAIDLIDEYDHASDAITVTHLNPSTDVVRTEKFLGSLNERFASDIKAAETAINVASKKLTDLGGRGAGFVKVLNAIAANKEQRDPVLKRNVSDMVRTFSRFDELFKTLNDSVAAKLKSTMPHYDAIRRELATKLSGFQIQFAKTGQSLNAYADKSTTPDSIKEQLLTLAESFNKTQNDLKQAHADLIKVESIAGYNELRQRLILPARDRPANSVVIMSPAKAYALELNGDIFVDAQTSRAVTQATKKRRFQGEERITGTLISMQLDQPPLVVFITVGQATPWSHNAPTKRYTNVRDRLLRMNFEVKTWNPSLKSVATSGGPQSVPPPTPIDGQKTVWVLIPPDPASNDRAVMMSSVVQNQIARHLDKRLKAGDGAMIMMSASPSAAMFADANPFVPLVRNYGVTPRLQKIVLREVHVAQGQTQFAGNLETNEWPEKLTMSSTINGIPGSFFMPSPLELGGTDTKTWPVAHITGNDIFVTDFSNPEQKPKRDPKTAKDRYIIGAAVEKDQARLIVITDKVWASDALTTAGEIGGGVQAYATINHGAPARWPANTELFVNGVSWLSHLDDLIAPSARTQDVPRIKPITKEARGALLWIVVVGLPAVIMFLGVGVWQVRRRG